MDPDDLIATALTTSDRQLGHALVRLSRVVAERAHVADSTRTSLDGHLPDLVRRAAASGVDLQDGLADVVEMLRPQVGALAAVDDLPPISAQTARLVGQVLLTAAILLEEEAKGSEALLPDLARLHSDLGIAFGHWGRRDWAVKAGRRAVELHRALWERHGAQRRAGLASALNNLAVALAQVGDTDAALSAGAEGVMLYRGLVDVDVMRHRGSLANALTNHGVRLGAVGRHAEALSCVEEATHVWRAAVDAGDDDARGDLAWALNNLSVNLAAVGRDGDGLVAVQEAVGLRRRLVDGDDESRAHLAGSLNNLSVRLGATGRREEGLVAIEEAVSIRRELAAADPNSYLPDLAQSLTNLSVDLTELGRPVTQRLAASEEAAVIRRNLVRTRPTLRPQLATAMHNLSIDLAADGQVGRALAAVEEAVDIRRALAAARPDTHEPDLAGSVRNLSVRLVEAGRPAEAADAAAEAVEMFRALVADRPELRAELATSLNNMSVRAGAVERGDEALAAIEEAVRIRRALAAENPDAHLAGLATSLNNLSVDLTRLGRLAEAVAASEETVAIRRALVAARRDLYLPGLATALNNLAVGLGDVGRHADALTVVTEAVEIRQTLVLADRRVVLPDLMMAIGNMAEQLDAVGRRADAERLFAGTLAAHSDDAWATGVVLLGRAAWHAECDDLPAAVADARDAMRLLQPDPARQAQARFLLRTMRRPDPPGFDAAWTTHAELPVWLRHLDIPTAVVDEVRTWIDTDDLDTAVATLTARSEVLLTDPAEAQLERLVDANPGHAWLRAHRVILRAARDRGVPAAYTEYRERLWRDGVARVLAGWMSAEDPDELRTIVTEEQVLLCSAEAQAQMEDLVAVDPGAASLLWRAGLLALCRSDGITEAFDLLADDATLNRRPGRRVLTGFEPRDLAVARIRAGRQPDDDEATFVHAVLALLGGRADEADHAITRSARHIPSWDRRTRAQHLTDLTEVRPDLTDGLVRLRALTGRT